MQLSQLFLEYAQHTQTGVARWVSHPPLEYTHHALPPLCQLWLPHLSLENDHHARPSTRCGYVASHPSVEYAHHAHLSASASCGYVAISLIPGVRTPRPARCGYMYVAISPIPGVRPPRPPLCLCQLWLRGYLTYPWSTHTTHSQVWLCGYLTHPWSTPTTPTSLPLPAVATWLSHLSRDHAHHAHPSTSCGYVASHQSLEYAHHAQPDVSMSPIPGVRPPRPPFASCGYVAISLIPGACLPRPLFYQLWLCGYTTKPWSTHLAICQMWLCGHLLYPLNTPATPTLCQQRLCNYLIYPWSTPILLPAAATRLLTWPWNTPTTPSQPQVWWLCGHLTFHQLWFSG